MRNITKITFKKTLFTIGLLLFISNCFSQNISLNFKNKPLSTVIKSIESQSEYRILFNTQKINNSKKVTISITNVNIEEALNTLTNYLGISYQIKNKQIVFVDKKIEKTLIDERIISGVVKDKSDNSLLPGASISVKGTAKGAITDFNGKFNYLVKSVDLENLVLVFSYLGHDKVEIKLGNKSYFEVFLEESTNSLNEIVITSSYGTQKLKEEVVGSIATVVAKDLGVEQPVVSFDELLEGQVAGVSIETNPQLGESVKINIRGQGSITPLNGNVVGTSTQPLIIIDGIILSEETGLDGNNFFDVGTGNLSENILNPLAKIGVDDIESFSILKDAAAVGLYGADAANGVIIITTKKGKQGDLKFNASSQVGITKAFNGLKFLNGEQYRSILNEYNKNSGNLQAVQPWNGVNTNWFDLLNTDGLFNRVNFSASGGKNDFTYRLSLGYQKTAEAQINNSYQKLNSSFSLGYRKDNFNASLVFSPSLTLKKDPNKLYSFALQPDIAPFTENGDFTPFPTFGNPLAVAEQNISEAKTFAFLTSLKADYSITDNLKISTLFGLDFSKKDEDRFFSGLNGSGDFGTDLDAPNGIVKGRRLLRDRDTERWNWNSNITYNTVFGENHNFDGILGIELRQEKVNFSYLRGDGFQDFVNPQPIENAFQRDFREDSSKNTGRSLFSQFNYNYNKKYFFLLNMRLDQSSAFGNDRNTAFNGGIGASWNISKEDFLIDNKFVDFLRLRISYGTTGNSRIGSYRALGLYTRNYDTGFQDQAIGYNDFNYANLSSAPNPNLTWETNKKFNIGLDFNFLQRFQFTTDFFRDEIVDQIVNRNVIVESGFTSAEINGAAMINQGIEFALNAEIIKNKNFSWSANFNFTTIQNEVTSLVGLGSDFSSAENARAQTVGFSTSTLWGFEFIGIDPANGRELFNVNNQIYDGAQVKRL